MLDIVRLEACWSHEEFLDLCSRDVLQDLVKASWIYAPEVIKKHPKGVPPLNLDFCERFHNHSKGVEACYQTERF